MAGKDIIIGIDAGTSVLKAVAFSLTGEQKAFHAIANSYTTHANGGVTQSLQRTWSDCAAALRGLSEKFTDLSARTAAISVTGQGDGTWLVGRDNAPVGDAWLWLDARAAPTVEQLAASRENRARFEATGTGLNTCQQGSQMAHMDRHQPELLDQAQTALHCKDWLHLNLTGVRATDPSEVSFTFGDFRTRTYNDTVIEALGLGHRRSLLPEVIDGTQTTHPLTQDAARETGLLAGTPVSLGYVDMVMTALGAGVYGGPEGTACSTVGSTGVHMRATKAQDVHLNAEGTGYVIALPVPGIVTQVQTNMAATLNIDWVLSLARDMMQVFGHEVSQRDLVDKIDNWLAATQPAQMLYHPYISEAGERGPFVNAQARANFTGLSMGDSYGDMVRAVCEGLGMAMRDCYAAMGPLPSEVRLTGGAARSQNLRGILGASLNAKVRTSSRDEAGAAGAAMMAAVAINAYDDMDACVAQWVTPLLGAPEAPDPSLAQRYSQNYPAFVAARKALEPTWAIMAENRRTLA